MRGPVATRVRGPGPRHRSTLALARREALQMRRESVQLDVVRTLRAIEHVRARWRAGAAIEPETMEAIFASSIGLLDDVCSLLVAEILAEHVEGEKPQ